MYNMKIQALLKKTEMMNSDRQVSSRDTTADTNMHQTLVYSPPVGGAQWINLQNTNLHLDR